MTAMDFKTAFAKHRHADEPGDAFAKAEADFNACVDRIQKRDSSTRLAAIIKAGSEHPEEWARYGEAGKHHIAKAEQPAPVETSIAKAAATLAKHDDLLEDLVRKSQRSDETFAKAYDRVLREQPALYTGRRELARALGA